MTVYKTITDLPAAGPTSDTDQLEISQGGTSRRASVAQFASTVTVVAVGVVYPVNYGARGDGVADDTLAMQAAIAAAAGRILDGAGLTYRITSTLTGVASNTTLRNMTLDFSTMPDQAGVDYSLRIDGTIGTAVPLTPGNTVAGTAVVTVGSTASFAVDQLVFLSSAAIWEISTNCIYGQYGRVKSIDSATQLTLADNVLLSFNVASTAVIAPVTPVSNVLLERVKFIGSNTNGRSQIALYATYAERLNIVSCDVYGFDYAGFGLFRAYKPVVHRCYIRKAVNTGNAYGIGVWGGTFGAVISDTTGEDVRHTVTIGDIAGINLYTTVVGCHAINSKDAGVDSHPSSMFTTISNNQVEMAAAQFATSSHDGIIVEGVHAVITGNTVIGAKGSGISHAPAMADPLVMGSTVIAGNMIVLDDLGYPAPTSSSGIYVVVNATSGGNLQRVTIANNTITGGLNNPGKSTGIKVRSNQAGSTITNVAITGNQINNVSDAAIMIWTTGGAIDAVEVSGNTADTIQTSALYFLSDTAGTSITNITGGYNILKSSSAGIRLQAAAGSVSNGAFGRNIYKSPTVNSVVVTGIVSNVTFDDAAAAANSNSAAATVTLGRTTNWFTFSRGTAQVATLPAPATSQGYEINFLNSAAQTVDSATANVVPMAGGAAVTTILPATAGKWVVLRSDGTNWRIVKGN